MARLGSLAANNSMMPGIWNAFKLFAENQVQAERVGGARLRLGIKMFPASRGFQRCTFVMWRPDRQQLSIQESVADGEGLIHRLRISQDREG